MSITSVATRRGAVIFPGNELGCENATEQDHFSLVIGNYRPPDANLSAVQSAGV